MILVTGGLGFIGSNLVKRLVKEKYEVTIIDNLAQVLWIIMYLVLG